MSAPEPSSVELFVGPNATRIDVWDRYTFDLSMLEVGTAFTFGFWHSEEARSPWETLIDPVRGLKCGHPVMLTIDGDAVLSGIVETRAVGDEFGPFAPAFMISGRDELGAAVSGDVDPTVTLAGRMLTDALEALYRGVGIRPEVSVSVQEQTRRTAETIARHRRAAFAQRLTDLRVKAEAGIAEAAAELSRVDASGPRPYSVTKASHPSIGEKVQVAVDRIVGSMGFRVWTTAAPASGGTTVIVDRPRTSGPPAFSLLRQLIGGRITDASNIYGGKETTSIAGVPTTVTVFADRPRGDSQAGKIERTVTNGFLLTPAASARIADNLRECPRYVESRTACTEAAAHNEAARICAEANERLRIYECTVLGHRQNGKLWVPNSRVSVRDELVGIDETMLLVSVQYSGGRQEGPRTRLKLLPEGAINEVPLREA